MISPVSPGCSCSSRIDATVAGSRERVKFCQFEPAGKKNPGEPGFLQLVAPLVAQR
jgi:hypothetical protein